MNFLREQAGDWLRQRRPAFVVEIAAAAGSVPREVGTRLLVAADEVAGTIGGGRLEFEAIRLAPLANLRMLAVDEVPAEVRTAGPGTFFLVLTHSHDLDLAICEAVLRRGDFGFLGLIGSVSKRARFLSRLRRRGLPAAALARMTCPIGMPGIRSKRPELIAVAVVAQMLVIALQRGEPEEQDVRTPGQGGRRPMTRT